MLQVGKEAETVAQAELKKVSAENQTSSSRLRWVLHNEKKLFEQKLHEAQLKNKFSHENDFKCPVASEISQNVGDSDDDSFTSSGALSESSFSSFSPSPPPSPKSRIRDIDFDKPSAWTTEDISALVMGLLRPDDLPKLRVIVDAFMQAKYQSPRTQKKLGKCLKKFHSQLKKRHKINSDFLAVNYDGNFANSKGFLIWCKLDHLWHKPHFESPTRKAVRANDNAILNGRVVGSRYLNLTQVPQAP